MNEINKKINKSYNTQKYRTPDGYASDIAVFTIVAEHNDKKVKAPPKRTLKIMLIQRAAKDREGKPNIETEKWALPGGFVKLEETAFEGAKRELKEETGIEIFHLKHFGVYDRFGRDKRGWIISNAFYAIVREEVLNTMKADDDAKSVKLFTIREALELELAFDHRQIITDAIELIKKDMVQTTVAKNFLTDEFTLSELRDVLLAVINYPWIEEKSVFFKKTPTLPFIRLVTDEYTNPVTTVKYSYRPARLYSFKEGVEPISSIYI